MIVIGVFQTLSVLQVSKEHLLKLRFIIHLNICN